MEDLLKKLALFLFIASGLMIFVIMVILVQNFSGNYPESKISGFYVAICVILLASGFYLRNLSKRQ
ncbi:MAG: hypothetical protein IPH28_09200 [Cytophagaceae bacterium]|nr:hypothetical protein [Cytophagaceae bacterium]MBL0303142.1 hypothetical protein [Cytophagaceae bacterium]MBL0325989.1 hypothetical protein [Cytophagaceae bacterium]